jgi:hypothetical protein
MASILPISHLRSDDDVMWVRRLLGWQAEEYDGRIRYETVPLAGLLPNKVVLFSSYTLAGFALPTTSFFLTLLENNGF